MVLRLKDMKFLEMSIIRRDNRYSTVQIEYRTDSEWCWDICKNVAFKFSWNIVYGQKYNAVLTLKDKQTIQDVSINEMFFKKLAFRHAGACLTLLRKIWEEWQKERKKDKVSSFLLLDTSSLIIKETNFAKLIWYIFATFWQICIAEVLFCIKTQQKDVLYADKTIFYLSYDQRYFAENIVTILFGTPCTAREAVVCSTLL